MEATSFRVLSLDLSLFEEGVDTQWIQIPEKQVGASGNAITPDV